MCSLKVLILEDNSFQLMALHQMLNANGVFNVLTAESVESALQSLDKTGPVDIAICDLYLEQGDGLELIRHLAEHQQARAVVLLSNAEPDVLEAVASMARQQGLNVLGCLPKPASVSLIGELLNTCQQHLRPGPAVMSLARVRELLSLREFECSSLGTDENRAAVMRHGVAWFQPMLGQDGQLQGVEALARWQHPERGLLLAGDFLPVLEYAGLEEAFTWHMLEQALQLSAEVHLGSGRPLPVAVNIPASMLQHAHFPRDLEALLLRYGLPARCLTLELVETRDFTTNTPHVEGLLRLRMIGCKLSIGDFGLGGTSLQRLLELPFTGLKIPPAFVCGMAFDERKAAVVAGAMGMATHLSLEVVVTGIESGADYDAVKALGDASLQGCFIAPPMNAQTLHLWITRHNKDFALACPWVANPGRAPEGR